MRRSKTMCLWLCLWLCLAHATGGWAGLPWSVPFAERVHHHLFSLTALALAEMHRADDARRDDLRRRGFPEKSAGVEGDRLGEVIVACLTEQTGAPYPFIFEDDDPYEQIVDRTWRRLRHAQAGFGPFGKYQVNYEEKRAMHADDVIDRMQRLSRPARACLDRAWTQHEQAYGTNSSFSPLHNDDVRQRMLELDLSIWFGDIVSRYVPMPLPVAPPAPPTPRPDSTWLEDRFWLVPLLDDHTPDERELLDASIADTLSIRFQSDVCAHAHLLRATCALHHEPLLELDNQQLQPSFAAQVVQAILLQAIARDRGPRRGLEQTEIYAIFRDWLAPGAGHASATGSANFNSLAEMLLRIEQQRCDRPHAKLEEECARDARSDLFLF